MSARTPMISSERTDRLEEAALRGSVRASLRKTASPFSYDERSDEEEDEEDDDINIDSSGNLLDKVSLEQSEEEELSDEEDDGEVRCKCMQNRDIDRPFVCCDGCGFWSHMSCYGLDEEADQEAVASKEFLCKWCQNRTAGGEVISLSKEVHLPVRKPSSKQAPIQGRKGGLKKDAVLSYYTSAGKLAVKDPNRRVSFDQDAKEASPEGGSGDEDGYHPPSDEAASDMDEDAEYRNPSDEEENPLFVTQPSSKHSSRQQHSPTPVPTQWDNGVEDWEVAKTPRAPGVTDLGEGIIKKWMAGGYSAEIDASQRDDDASDTSSIDIPDMSDGDNLLEKLAKQDRTIFTLKKKLETRGNRIVKLKREVNTLRGENDFLMHGGDEM